MIRSEMIRWPASPCTFGSSSPPSALTMMVGRRAALGRCAAARPASAAAPAVNRKARRSSSIIVIAGLFAADRSVIGPLEAPPFLNDEQDRAHVRNVDGRVAGEHDHVGEAARRNHATASALAQGHRADLGGGAD